MDKSGIQFAFGGVWLVLIAIASIAVLIAFYKYKKDAQLGGILKKTPLLKWILIGLKSISIFSIALLLCHPKYIQKKTEYISEKHLILQDVSASISKNDGQIGKRIAEQLSQSKETIYLTFEDGLGKDSTIGNPTNISKALQEVSEQFGGQNLGSITLLSDGIHNKGISPLFKDYNMTVPIHTIGLGDTIQRPDLRVSKVESPKLVYLNSNFEIQSSFEAILAEGNHIITLKDKTDGKNNILEQKQVTVEHSPAIWKSSFIIEPQNVGINKFEIEISKIETESELKNNSRTFFVDVLDGKQKIDFIFGSIQPDIRAISNSISKDINYDINKQSLSSFEFNQETNLIILAHPNKNIKKLEKIITQCVQKNISMLVIIGTNEEYNYLKSATTKHKDLLSYLSKTSNTSNNKSQSSFSKGFGKFRISEKTKAVLKELPGLNCIADLKWKAPQKETLLFQKIGKVETDFPLLSFQNYRNNKFGFLFTNELWKWQLSDYALNKNHEAFDELINQTTKYLASKISKRKFSVQSKGNSFLQGSPVAFEAFLYDDNFDLIQEGQIKLKIIDQNQRVFSYNFIQNQSNYFLEVKGLPVGNYTYEASSNLTEGKVEKGSFFVQEQSIENIEKTANHKLLRELSLTHEGNHYKANNVDQLIEYIKRSDSKKLAKTTTETISLIDLKFMFLLIIMSLSTEWFLRKYFGGY